MIVMLVAPQPGTRVAMGREAASQDFYALDHGEGVDGFAARTIRIRHYGDGQPGL